MGRVQDKVAIVTGAAANPSLGRATAMRLAGEGAKVVVTDVNEAGVKDTAAQIEAAGGEALALVQDVTDENRWKEVINATVERFGRLDVLVNNAGIAVLAPMSELTLDDWNRQINVNLTSVFLGCKYGMEAMRQSGGGSIINLSSVAGLIGLQTCTAYGASKGGVRLMSKSVALEGAADNIRCNSVHPGVMWTTMQAQAVGSDKPEDTDVSPDRVPLGRLGTAEDIANAVLYLASDESSYVTGTEVTVDAGMTCQ